MPLGEEPRGGVHRPPQPKRAPGFAAPGGGPQEERQRAAAERGVEERAVGELQGEALVPEEPKGPKEAHHGQPALGRRHRRWLRRQVLQGCEVG